MTATAVETVTLTGKSGRNYKFMIYPRTTAWAHVPGVYVVLRDKGATWGTIYIGQTDDLAARLASHHKEPCFNRHGWTHLGYHHESSEAQRRIIEQDLLARYICPCND
ncbi:MAG: GIY-YIG nuclease family protein [Spiribacter salinus]|uniref:GIY-YIG nuclease family protein n=1 Tax=Spiribacter salinus TaxID=1335746 RepID=A0A540VTW5_9GAMM|nr:MAG: GIY-YIG nuclease family protein [Spiribacter salinus]